ncbi:MAG: alpha/beta hydrolase [Acidobacteriota bacterium]|nr:alpha/beta hydrolase [Acidobacteriota bacterium]
MVLVFLSASALAQDEDSLGERVRYVPGGDVEVGSDIVYARYGERELRLDLYLPTDRGARPIPGIVVVRGGGWRIGDKEGFAAIASALASRGLATVNDVKAAVRWMRANAASHDIDPDALGAIGGSAGAHLVAILATTHRMDKLDGEGGHPDESNRIQAAVAMAIPSDLTAFAADASGRASEAMARFLGASHADDPDLWTLASPLSHVHAKAAPLLLIHSDADRTVLHEQSVSLRARYEEMGVVAELVTIEGAPHAFWNWVRWFDSSMDRAAGFFQRHLAH